MRGRNLRYLVGIAILVAVAIWIDLPSNPGLHIKIGSWEITKPIEIRQGLDLQGGLQVLLEADLPSGESVTADAMSAARTIVENRVNALGVTEPVVQQQGTDRIIVELPGIQDPDEAVATIRETGLLEFIDAGNEFLEPGTVVRTTFGDIHPITDSVEITITRAATATEPLTPTEPVTPTAVLTETVPVTDTAVLTDGAPAAAGDIGEGSDAAAEPAPTPATDKIYRTVMTGRDLESADVALDEYGNPEIVFKLKPAGARIFAEHTRANIGKVLAIALDKVIISSPTIQSAIPDGSGRITGRFTLEEARSIAVQLRYGALPVPLRVETIRTVGPTLGEESIQKSVQAGIIGLIVVLTFMLVYYRLPGFLADCALLIFGLLNFAVYKWGIPTFQSPFFVPVTLTLPGITGFILSTGMAVDANILIFERMKEELRAGRSLGAAIDAGFDRAWTSIRDSNLSALIICVILYWFGSNFGASAVKGFAITLFLGVSISMFTAITVTRTFIRFVFDVAGETLRENKWLLGV